jgi:hypothetical protein
MKHKNFSFFRLRNKTFLFFSCLFLFVLFISNSVSAFNFPSSGGTSITTTYNYINATNESEYWITSDGTLDDVSEIQGSWLTNDLSWITNAVSDLVNYYTKAEVLSLFNFSSFNKNLTQTDCGVGEHVLGVSDNGSVSCSADAGADGYCGDGSCADVFYWDNSTFLNETDIIKSVNATDNIQKLGFNTSAEIVSAYVTMGSENLTKLHCSNITGVDVCSLTTCDDGHCSSVFYWNNASLLNETDLVNNINSTAWHVSDSLDNRSKSHCSNITGATSDLCTITSSADGYCGDGSCVAVLYWSNATLFNETELALSINKTTNIEYLINATLSNMINIYLANANDSYRMTYNETYHSYAENVSRNWTQITFDTYNTTWDDVLAGGNASWNESYANTLYINKTALNTTVFEESDGFIHIVEDWLVAKINALALAVFNSNFRNWFDQELNVSSSPSFAELNITGGYIWNGSDKFSFTDLNATGTGMSSEDVNVTVNVYLGNANASYLTTFNATYHGYPEGWNTTINQYLTNANDSYLTTYNETYHAYSTNVSKNWTEITYDTYNAIWGAGMNSEEVNTTINQYLTNANDSYLTTYNATYHDYPANWNASINQYLTNANASYLDRSNASYESYNTTGNAQALLNGTNILFANITFNGGGYITDNGTTIIIGHT